MAGRESIPCALTVAGSDSGGGAGIQADLKTFAAVGVHGTSVITCVTAQNPRRVRGFQVCSPSIIRRQLEAVFEELCPAAAKTGMLHSAETIRVVARFLRRRKVPLIVDPVMVAGSGARLLKKDAVPVLSSELLPLATLITPNVAEAEILVRASLQSVEDLRAVARELHGRFGCGVLVKGGHLRGVNDAVDIFYDGKEELVLSAAFVRGLRTHGTGCTYSAAITAYLARGLSLPKAVCEAKQFITNAIVESQISGGHVVLNSFWRGGLRSRFNKRP